MDWITEIKDYVKNRFWGELEPQAGAYRYYHTLRVAGLGRQIAQAEGLDQETLILACLLHDIGYVQCKTQADFDDHGRLSAAVARECLTERGYDPEKVDTICFGIRIHTLADSQVPRQPTALEQSVSDADNIDRFDAYRLYEGFSWEKPETKAPAELLACAQKRIFRYTQYLEMPFGTKTATALWQDRLGFCIAFFQRLQAQMEATLAW